jgi:hypothetical protein
MSLLVPHTTQKQYQNNLSCSKVCSHFTHTTYPQPESTFPYIAGPLSLPDPPFPSSIACIEFCSASSSFPCLICYAPPSITAPTSISIQATKHLSTHGLSHQLCCAEINLFGDHVNLLVSYATVLPFAIKYGMLTRRMCVCALKND